MTAQAIVVAIGFAALGAGAERLASVWPSIEASRRGPGIRTAGMAVAAGAAGGAIVARSTLPWWATGVVLVLVALLVVLSATDLDQRRLPHVALDPLILIAAAFAPFNPGLDLLTALIGAAAAAGFLGLLGLLIRGGIALGDIYLVVPLGLLLGWPAVFSAIFLGAVLSALVSLVLLASRRVGMRSYIPFGPFLVAGALVTLLREPGLLGPAVAALGALGVR